MKGIVFTMDALFALVIAAAGISMLLYVSYTTQAPAAIHYSDVEAILESLASTSISSMANGSWIAQGIVMQYAGANETSPGFLGGPYADSGGVSGPLRPILDFAFNPQNTITTGVVAAYGNIYFAANSMLYSVNATTNKLAWSVNTITNVAQTPVLYSGMLFFANSTNLTAVSALTGAMIWSTNAISAASATLTSPILAYDNQLIFGMSDAYVHAYYASNGTSYWSNYTGTNPTALAVVGGDISAVTSSGSLYIIVHAGSTAKQVYSKTFAAGNAPTRPAGSGAKLFFGSGSSANATYVNGTTAAGFPVGVSQSVTGAAYYGSYVVYQTSGGDVAIVPSGTGSTTEWSYTAPSYFGSALTNAVPVVTGSMTYTLWSNGLAAQNLSTGSLQWFAGLQSSINPYMTLAYGRLYVVANNKVLAYGSCFAPPQATLLSAVSTMYMNSQAGCGMALLNNLYPSANYSFFVGSASTNTLKAANFNGASSSYIEVSSTSSLPVGSAARTITAWVYTGASGPNLGAVGWGTPGTTPGDVSDLGVYPVNTVFFWGWEDVFQSNLIVPPHAWTFIAASYSAGANTITVYEDGNSQTGTLSGGVALNTPSGTPLYIGISPGGSSTNLYNGSIANVQIYNTSLSSSKVHALYLEGISGAPANPAYLVGWWPLAGDANDYASGLDPGFTTGGVGFTKSSYTLPAFSNAYIVSKASTPLSVLNYSTGTSNTINVGVYSWS